MTIYLIFFAGLGFFIFLIGYLSAEDEATRRRIGFVTILLSLIVALLSVYPIKDKIRLGLDLKGGTSFLIELQGQPSEAAIQQAISVIRKRLDFMGTREIIIQPMGSNRISVAIPGLSDTDKISAREQLSRVAKLEFRLVAEKNTDMLAAMEANHGKLPPQYLQQYEVLQLKEVDPKTKKEIQIPIVVKRTSEMSGKHVKRAFRTIGEIGRPEVVIQFDDEGAKLFGDLTGKNVNRRLAIVLDNEVKSAPNINSAITGGTATISGGSMTQVEAEELASVLENPLETPVKIVEERGVDPSLGADSVKSGRTAGVVALIGVIAFMTIYYRISGVISVVALMVNLLLLLGLLAQFHFTLTMPGIAGIVLTIGMAVDANVLIYERIRDELALKKPLRNAIDAGFERAFSAIFDSNVTTLIPAVVLAFLGTGPLRGFAVTLTIGIVTNLFAALVVSRNCFDWLLASKNHIQTLKMMQFLHNPRFDFLKYRRLGIGLSVIVLLGGAMAASQRGQKLLGVDFTGGDSVIMKYEKAVPLDDVRKTLVQNGIDPSLLQFSPESNTLRMQTKQGEGERAARILSKEFLQAGFAPPSLDSVGAQVGDELKQRAVVALGLGLLGILIYAALRFELSFAIASAIGQLHDVLIALSIMAIFGRELTLPLVGAFLTIAGYSINDKIVVFDRIREGMKLREKGTFYEIINRSLNLTLARTLLTGGTMIIATMALIIFGGPVIYDFSVAMLIGILSGIYSSHFVSPPLAWWIDSYKEGTPAPGGSKVAPTVVVP